MKKSPKGLGAKTAISLLLLLLVVSIASAITLGPVQISIINTYRILLSNFPFIGGFFPLTGEETSEIIIMSLRLPRAIMGVLVGASLAVAGVVTQSLFRNPMADPFVIGISSGAALGASVAILFGIGGFYALPLLAFAGAIIAAFIVYTLARTETGIVTETLLLSGIAVAYFLSSLTAFLLYTAGEELHKIIFWLMGGLWASTWNKTLILLPIFMISFGILQLLSRDLNAMLLGEEPALHLGVEVENIKKIILIAASLLAGVAVAFAGTIGFVGLIIPHITRLVVGPDHRVLLPSSALVGALFLVWSDTLARTIISPAEIPVGIITAFFGAPFFLYLLLRHRRPL
jgi:iron complex transport system permease protein